jgi:hypothetical protein
VLQRRAGRALAVVQWLLWLQRALEVTSVHTPLVGRSQAVPDVCGAALQDSLQGWSFRKEGWSFSLSLSLSLSLSSIYTTAPLIGRGSISSLVADVWNLGQHQMQKKKYIYIYIYIYLYLYICTLFVLSYTPVN